MECSPTPSTGTSTSPSTVEPQTVPIVSQPSSPRSTALPSPPDSPSQSPSDSVSSLPSVSSSFFFSSAAASPPRSNPASDHARESTQGLIIPSLTLPAPLRRPTPYGQTLGDLRLLVVGSKGSGKTYLSGSLVEDNEDIIDVGSWEDADHGCSVLYASTDWIEHSDEHGLEKFEPSKNVEIIMVPGYEHNDDPQEILQSISSMIEAPFHSLAEVINPQCSPSAVLSNLLSSPSTPLYTAIIFMLSSSPSPLEILLIDMLGPKIPIILLPRLSSRNPSPTPNHTLSSFRPTSIIALRTGLFRSTDTLASLRAEAADRFLRWREVERALDDLSRTIKSSTKLPKSDWSKREWEAEWEGMLSQDVARAKRARERDNTLTQANTFPHRSAFNSESSSSSCINSSFDPLHFPSLVFFSLSLLRPARQRVGASLKSFVSVLRNWQVGLALVGGFCFGIGIGLFLK
ncbi:hypothetical protein PILCRDRAFT_458637 [Piloderma croceum F 1598]|uniref:Septin-type G domain-containing protein n=1 Tax=Piloderma croceum (strain F 1598) TaxID=765440 RepID=A0A0C3B966_PILCF|nr:hypothetical protein PILCRDRAFT_458637 [Piloderma croceum F 1598]